MVNVYLVNDVWCHITSFCDIKERGRIHISNKYVVHKWIDLIMFHLHHTVPLHLFKDIIQGRWEMVQAFATLQKNVILPSGKTILCWSPWCAAQQLQLTSLGIRVYFKMDFNTDHAKFILWLRRLVCTKRKCSLLQAVQLLAFVKWEKKFKIPVLRNTETVYEKYVLLERPFRVKLTIEDFQRFRCSGYPQLHIKCFEFRDFFLQRNYTGPTLLLKN